MLTAICVFSLVLVATNATLGADAKQRVQQVSATTGLIAFWDFKLMREGKWTSHYDDDVVKHGYPVLLRRIGDTKSYSPADWPYDDEESKLVFDASGPFGHAVRFNKGYCPSPAIFGSPIG